MKSKYRIYLALALAISGCSLTWGQDQHYGSNTNSGHYLQVGDAKLYYEVYGQGPPLLLLHGGLYGYIDEFGGYIPELSKHFTVIAPAMRGHGRSELGSKPFSLHVQAEEAFDILRKVSDQPAIVLGFSHGAKVAYMLAATHPESVRKLIAIGAGVHASPEAIAWAKGLTAESFLRENRDFVQNRQRLMPEPDRWNEFFNRLLTFYASDESLSDDQAKSIRCPALVIGGDKDFYNSVQGFVRTRDLLPNAYLILVPNCDHVGSLQKPAVLREFVMPFVLE